MAHLGQGLVGRAGQLAGALVLAFLLGGTYLAVGQAPVLQAIEAQTLNTRFQLRGPQRPGPETVVLAIDDRSVAAFGQWPVPRGALAQAVRALATDGARVIAFDLLFAEAVPGAPAAADAVGRGAAGGAEEGDAALAAAMAEAGAVVLPFAFTFGDGEARQAELPPALERAAYRVFASPRATSDWPGPRPSGVVAPPRPLLAAASPAHANVFLDGDGSLRQVQPVIRHGEAFYPSLPLEVARRYLGVARDRMVIRIGEGIQLGDRFLPADRQMRLTVNHYGEAGSFPAYSLVDLLEGRIAPGTFRGHIVLIGSTALGTGSTFVSPYTRNLPAVEHHATVIDNILHERFLLRRDSTLALDLVAVVAGSFAAAVLALFCAPFLAGVGLLALLLGWGALTVLAFAEGLWLGFVFPAAAVVLSFLCFALLRSLAEGRLRRSAERQRRNLSRYVPEAVASGLADRDPELASDRIQPAAVMFLDIVGFTTLNERMAPADAMALLRAFHRRVERAVHEHGGSINQFVGDGAMASFGLPRPSARDAGNAIACARHLAADIEGWSAERRAGGEPPIRIGIGLHYGPVAVGEIGGERQAQFTITGDTVNVASRLEALTRQHGTAIIASDALIEAAAGAAGGERGTGFEKLTPQPIRGREDPLGVWAWRGPPGEAGQDGGGETGAPGPIRGGLR